MLLRSTRCLVLARFQELINNRGAALAVHTSSGIHREKHQVYSASYLNELYKVPTEKASEQTLPHVLGKSSLKRPHVLNTTELSLSISQLAGVSNSVLEMPFVNKSPMLDKMDVNIVGILDDMLSRLNIIETPTRHQDDTVIGDTASVVKKEGRMIQKIKRWKMNRHQLKKFRKRMLYHNRKMRFRKEKKKEKILQEELNVIRLEGENFDAKQFVLSELETARRGGFKIDIWDTWKTQKQA